MLISCSAINKTYTGEPLFQDLTLTLQSGERLGIIGPNGSGKSTLLSIICKRIEPDQGTVATKRGIVVGWARQETKFTEDAEVMSLLRASAAKSRLSVEERQKAISITAAKTGLNAGLVKSLSGGMQKRLTLACAIVQSPDLLLLDEPTNHLDVEGILWLEELLLNAPFAWATVTHDRWFLERTAARILEINRAYPRGYLMVDGGYQRFLDQRTRQRDAQQQERESLANKVRRETDWLRHGPKARTTKAKARIEHAYELTEALRQIQERLRQESTSIIFNASQRKTKILIEVKKITKSFDDRYMFKELDFVLSSGLRLGLLGGNGSGKTTLLKILAKQLQPDSGNVIHATDLQIAFFDQNRSQINPQWTLKRALCEEGDSVVVRGQALHVISWAKRFQFRPDQLNTPVAQLSGGEQARLAISRLMLTSSDILLLDEPTNDLDIPALESLEESLLEFPGAIILVTHDRYLIDRICHGYIGLDGRGGAHFFATYEQWERELRSISDKRERKSKPPQTKKQANAPSLRKLSYLDQRELDQMEETILSAEAVLQSCEKILHDPQTSTNPKKMKAAATNWEDAKIKVDQLYERWAELSRIVQE